MHELKEAEIQRQFFLGDSPMGSQLGMKQRPEPFNGVDGACHSVYLGAGLQEEGLPIIFPEIQMLRDVIERTDDVTLVTDGERRYANLLFEIYHEVVRSGRRGRPPKLQ